MAMRSGTKDHQAADGEPAARRRGGAEHVPPHGTGARDHPQSASKPLSAYLVAAGRDPLTEAFAEREFAPPWRGAVAIDPREANDVIERVFATPRTEPAVAYIHVPYCQTHCLFCGFFQNTWRPLAGDAFVDDVLSEIDARARTPLVASAPIEAVYIGGGTPTALSSEALARLIAGLRRLLPLAQDCEITLEGRSYDFGVAKAAAVLDVGVNRISLGVQTFDTAIRRRLGRKLDGRAISDFLAGLVRLDSASVVCDLIYGLPGQDDRVWKRDLDAAVELGLDGLTLYALNVWRGGPLARAIANGHVPPAATLARQALAYRSAADLLRSRGWRRLSQSHFARTPRERNRYNAAIKRGASCLPFGSGAGGQAHGHRWRNVIATERRAAMRAEGYAAVEGVARLPPDYRAQAAIAGGLETGALDLCAVEALAPGFRAAAAPLIESWAAAGLGETAGELFRTTDAGAFWITNLTSGLYAALERARLTYSRRTGGERMNEATGAAADARARLAARLAHNPDGVIEVLAREHGVTPLEATRMLPPANCRFAPATAFAGVMAELAEWGDVLFVVHTPNIVLECECAVPPGAFGRGYFNLHGDSPIGGHIKADRCAAIAFVRRPFMGKESCSLQFFDQDGDAMFKVFVRRLPDGVIDLRQAERFEALGERFAAASA